MRTSAEATVVRSADASAPTKAACHFMNVPFPIPPLSILRHCGESSESRLIASVRNRISGAGTLRDAEAAPNNDRAPTPRRSAIPPTCRRVLPPSAAGEASFLRLDKIALSKLAGIGGRDRLQKPPRIGGAPQQTDRFHPAAELFPHDDNRQSYGAEYWSGRWETAHSAVTR